MVQIDLTPPQLIFRPALSTSLLKLTGRKEEHELTLEEFCVVDYLSDLLNEFLPTDVAFTQDEQLGRLDTATNRIRKALESGKTQWHSTAKFTLYLSGIFYEWLQRLRLESFYEEAGSGTYRRLQRQAEWPEFRTLYGMLADNFGVYEAVIRNARNTSMYFERNGDWFKIVPYHKRLPIGKRGKMTVH